MIIESLINPECCWGGANDIAKYIAVQNHRKSKYKKPQCDEYNNLIEEINQNGYGKIKNFIDLERLEAVKRSFNEIRDNNNLQYSDEYTQQVGHPLLTCDGVFDIAFDDELIKIASNFFGCLPVVNNVQLRKSIATSKLENQLSGNGQTTRWHCDKDSPRFLKFFFYLDDVNINNGPFTYVHGSHIQKFEGWRNNYRWPEAKIIEHFGNDKIINICGERGDLIMANTNGFHKGKKVENGERLLLTVYYGIHPTEWKKLGGKMRKTDFESLPPHKKPLAVYLSKE